MSTGVPVLLPKFFNPKLAIKLVMGGFFFISFLTILFINTPLQLIPTAYAESESIQFQLPHPGYVSTSFSAFHPGIDIAAGLGMPIRPLADGKVIAQGFNFWGLGLVIEIEHPQGYKSLYAHLGQTFVQIGQSVTTSTIIGEVGLTGNTSGPHTHLQLSRNGANLDPQPLMPQLPDISVAGTSTSSAQFAGGNFFKPKPKATPTPTPTPEIITSKLPTTTVIKPLPTYNPLVLKF